MCDTDAGAAGVVAVMASALAGAVEQGAMEAHMLQRVRAPLPAAFVSGAQCGRLRWRHCRWGKSAEVQTPTQLRPRT